MGNDGLLGLIPGKAMFRLVMATAYNTNHWSVEVFPVVAISLASVTLEGFSTCPESIDLWIGEVSLGG